MALDPNSHVAMDIDGNELAFIAFMDIHADPSTSIEIPAIAERYGRPRIQMEICVFITQDIWEIIS